MSTPETATILDLPPFNAALTGNERLETVKNGQSVSISTSQIADVAVSAATLLIEQAVAGKADLESPLFTGIPEAPTRPLGDSSNAIASTEFSQRLASQIYEDFANPTTPGRGAALVAFKSPLAGAVARNVRDFANDFVSIATWGGKGDLVPSTGAGFDNSDAFEAAAASGRRVYLPPGKYRVNRKIATTAATSFYGDSPDSTRIYFYDCDGFDYDLTGGDWNRKIVFENIAIVTTALGTRTGIKVTRSSNTNKHIGTELLDVAFVGGDIYPDVNNQWPGQPAGYMLEWGTAFIGTQVDSFVAERVYIRGASQAGVQLFPRATRGIVLVDTTYVYARAMMIFFQDEGFTISGQSEGIRVESSDFVQCNWGYKTSDLVSPSNHHIVINNHFSCRTRAVHIPLYAGGLSSNNHVIANNFCLKLIETGLGIANYIAMYLGVGLSEIRGNTFQSNATGDYIANGDIGVYIAGWDNHVTGNIGYNCGTTVYLAATVVDNVVSGNTMFAAGAGTGRCVNDSSGNLSNLVFGNTDNKGGTIGAFSVESNIQLGRPGAAARTRYFDALTSGNNIVYDSRLEFIGGSATQGTGEVRVRAGTLNVLAATTVLQNVQPGGNNANNMGHTAIRWANVYATQVVTGVGTAFITSGTGSPEGVTTAPMGSTYYRTDASPFRYTKQSGNGNVGWVAF